MSAGPPPATAPLTVADFAPLARERLPEPVWHYIDGGSGDEISLRANPVAFDRMPRRDRAEASPDREGRR